MVSGTGERYVQFPSEDDPADVPTRVLELFEEITDADAQSLPPLYGAIDPDALDSIISDRSGNSGFRRIEFEYADHLVAVYADGRIVVEASDRD